MKLEPDIVRDVLLFLEDNLIYEDFEGNNPHVRNSYTSADICKAINKDEMYMDADIVYAVNQLYKAGYITSENTPKYDAANNIVYMKINDITWNGHQFLNNIRPQTVWETVKKKAAMVGGASLNVLADIASNTLSALLLSINEV